MLVMPDESEVSVASEAPAVSDRLEVASSGRAKCRACGEKIDKGILRYGEALASGYGEGDAASLFWFHPLCAALRRPEKFARIVRSSDASAGLPDRDHLLAVADEGLAHPKLERVAGVEQASSGRARCRQCQELIAQGTWRVRLSTFGETGFFDPLGFVHAACVPAYFEVPSVKARLSLVAPGLDLSTVDI
jgi:hypothetical protein